MVEFDILTQKPTSQRRPMLVLVCALIAGLMLPVHPFAGGAILLLCATLSRNLTTLFAYLLVSVFGLILAILADAPDPDSVSNLPVDTLFQFQGTVESIASPRLFPYPTTSAHVRIHSCRGDSGTWPSRGRIHMVIRGHHDHLLPGDRFQTLGVLRTRRSAGNPGEFHRPRTSKNRWPDRTLLISNPSAIKKIGRSNSLRSRVDRFRHDQDRRLASTLPPDVAALASALLLGQRNRDLKPISRDFRLAGVSHLLAISGLHLGLLLGALSTLIRSLPIPARISPYLLLLSLPPLVLVTGSAPPVVRSALVSAGALLAPLLHRRVDALNLLSLAAIIQLIPDPHLLYTPSFQLSYVASTGIVVASHPLRSWLEPSENMPGRRIFRSFLSALATSLAAWTFTVPWTVFLFGRLVPFAPIASVLLLPIFTLTLLAHSLVLLFGGWIPIFPGPLIETSIFLSRIFLDCATCLGRIPSAPLPTGLLIPSLLAFASLILFLRIRSTPRLRMSFLFLTPWITLTSLLISPWTDELAVTFLDVGHGSTAVVHLPGRKALIVDPGSSSIANVGKRIVLPYLEATGVRTLVGIVVSHDDADHHNGVSSILNRFPGLPIWVSSYMAQRSPDRIARWKNSGGTLRIVSSRTPFALTEFVEMWNPSEEVARTDNDSSLVLRISKQGRSVLLPGDLEEKGVEDLLRASFLVPAQVLAAPHHGARLNNLDRLLKTARAEHLVVSARSGFSDPEGLQIASRMGLQVHTTWSRGAVTVRWTDGPIEISSFR